jgi:hypothetical protein
VDPFCRPSDLIRRLLPLRRDVRFLDTCCNVIVMHSAGHGR